MEDKEFTPEQAARAMKYMETFLSNFSRRITNKQQNEIIGKTKISDVLVSTVFTLDCGYETAICADMYCSPVERYKTRAEATLRHERWANKITESYKDGQISIIELGPCGHTDLIPDKEVIIKLSAQKGS